LNKVFEQLRVSEQLNDEEVRSSSQGAGRSSRENIFADKFKTKNETTRLFSVGSSASDQEINEQEGSRSAGKRSKKEVRLSKLNEEEASAIYEKRFLP
jgi:hypothetical protein